MCHRAQGCHRLKRQIVRMADTEPLLSIKPHRSMDVLRPSGTIFQPFCSNLLEKETSAFSPFCRNAWPSDALNQCNQVERRHQ